MSKSVSTNSSSTFLTVPELAELLHVNEKKIYKLAGEGDIPGTKITGKWIFPRHLIEDWISENSHGGAMSDRLIIAGSDDTLIKRVCTETAIALQQSALLSYSPYGTRHGLRMLDTRRADACVINWGETDSAARRHMGLLRSYKNHGSWIIVRCIQRTQGLIVSRQLAQNEMSVKALLDNTSLRWAKRNEDSGTERLLEDVFSTSQSHYAARTLSNSTHTERSAVSSVNTGHSDITCGAQATAHEFQLPFVPLADVSLDIVMTRRTYFRTLTQTLLDSLMADETRAIAEQLQGYTLRPQADLHSIE